MAAAQLSRPYKCSQCPGRDLLFNSADHRGCAEPQPESVGSLVGSRPETQGMHLACTEGAKGSL